MASKKTGFLGKKPKIEAKHAALACQTVRKIIESSELKALWGESEDYSKWQDVQQQLISKLSSA